MKSFLKNLKSSIPYVSMFCFSFILLKLFIPYYSLKISTLQKSNPRHFKLLKFFWLLHPALTCRECPQQFERPGSRSSAWNRWKSRVLNSKSKVPTPWLTLKDKMNKPPSPGTWPLSAETLHSPEQILVSPRRSIKRKTRKAKPIQVLNSPNLN